MQGFFCRLLEKHWLDAADREKGRLRTFLIVAMKKFMAKEWRRASAQRRGGGQSHRSLDTTFAEGRHAADPDVNLSAEAVFDREWALTLLGLTLERLRAEFVAAGKPREFEALKGCLMVARGAIDYAAVAEQLAQQEFLEVEARFKAGMATQTELEKAKLVKDLAEARITGDGKAK